MRTVSQASDENNGIVRARLTLFVGEVALPGRTVRVDDNGVRVWRGHDDGFAGEKESEGRKAEVFVFEAAVAGGEEVAVRGWDGYMCECDSGCVLMLNWVK